MSKRDEECTPSFWRGKAAEARAIAKDAICYSAELVVLDIARSYDVLAESAEREERGKAAILAQRGRRRAKRAAPPPCKPRPVQ